MADGIYTTAEEDALLIRDTLTFYRLVVSGNLLDEVAIRRSAVGALDRLVADLQRVENERDAARQYVASLHGAKSFESMTELSERADHTADSLQVARDLAKAAKSQAAAPCYDEESIRGALWAVVEHLSPVGSDAEISRDLFPAPVKALRDLLDTVERGDEYRVVERTAAARKALADVTSHATTTADAVSETEFVPGGEGTDA